MLFAATFTGMKRSPYNLLQEIYLSGGVSRNKIWKVFVCCMLLSRTSREQVDRIRKELFARWPDSFAMSSANTSELSDLIRSLGFGTKRAEGLVRMSRDFDGIDWADPSELFGLGQYASDAYQIFVLRKKVKNPSDHFLHAYQEWLYKGRVDGVKLERSKRFTGGQ